MTDAGILLNCSILARPRAVFEVEEHHNDTSNRRFSWCYLDWTESSSVTQQPSHCSPYRVYRYFSSLL